MREIDHDDVYLGAEAAVAPLYFGASGVTSATRFVPYADHGRPDRRALPPVRLQPDDLVAIHEGRGARITVERGGAWLTQTHDTRDIMLRAGESFVLDRDGVALIQCRRETVIGVAVPGDGTEPRIVVTGPAAAAQPPLSERR